MEQQPQALVCAPVVLPVNRDQLRVCYVFFIRTETPKPAPRVPDAQNARPGRGFYLQVLLFFFPG